MPGMNAGFKRGERREARVGADALVAVDERCGCPASSRPQIGMISSSNSPASLRGGRLLVAGERELVLFLAADALRLGEELGGDAHVQRAFAGAREELGVEVDAGVHRDVVHVLQAADDLHVLGASDDRRAPPGSAPAGCCRRDD